MCESDYYDDDCLLDDMIEDASIYFDKEQSDLKQNNMTTNWEAIKDFIYFPVDVN